MSSWYQDAADLILQLDSDDFAQGLESAVRRALHFDYLVIFSYRGPARPKILHDNFPAANKDCLVHYQDNTYVMDPFYQASTDNQPPGVYRMRDLAPESYFEFEQGSYDVMVTKSEEMGYRTIYWPEGLEEIGLFVKLDAAAMVVFSFYRRVESPAFTDHELETFREVVPIIDALTRYRWRGLWQDEDMPAPGGERGEATGFDVESVFLHLEDSNLTDREREVISLILKGHSSESIGLCLTISEETVKTHRKNAYAKLAISSQSELFALFIDVLSRITRIDAGDVTATV